ncbi:MAG: SPOR domain-containing protein [Crocinitomicaceae bacterium]|nr:SPOR domain-containing protein [Crocinitomicaceae bacterium]
MKASLLILLGFVFSLSVYSQEDDENWMLMEGGQNKTVKKKDSTKKSLNFNSGKSGNIQVKVDPRVNGLIKHNAEDGEIWGYRVQIFFDKSKEDTDREKAKFKTRYGHSVECYVEYKAPNYRVKVGDFRTEIEAENFKQDLLGVFPTAFVVKEKIKLPKLNISESIDNENQDN